MCLIKKVERSLLKNFLGWVSQPIKKRLNILNDFRLLSNLIANQLELPIPQFLKTKLTHKIRLLLMSFRTNIFITKATEILTLPKSR